MMTLTHTYNSIQGAGDIALNVVLAIICIAALVVSVCAIIEYYKK